MLSVFSFAYSPYCITSGKAEHTTNYKAPSPGNRVLHQKLHQWLNPSKTGKTLDLANK